MRITSFIWDEFNTEKCQKHGLALSQIEEFLTGKPYVIKDELHSIDEVRLIAFGKLREKLLLVVFTLRVENKVIKFRVISARYARKKEIERLDKNEEAKSKVKTAIQR